jgi:hypothetical protein
VNSERVMKSILNNYLINETTEIEYFLIANQGYGIKIVEKSKNVDTVVFEKDNISENADFVKQLIEVIAKSTYNFELLPDIIDDLRGNNTVLI